MKKLLILSIAAICCAATAQAKDILVVESVKNLKCNDSVEVYSPAAKVAERNLPTLFLLHGYGGNYSTWGRRCDLQRLSDSTGFRIICPDGFFNGWYVDEVDTSKMQWRTFFWEELWPLIEEKYGIPADRTFISGLSMGGFGAMSIYLEKPEKFRAGGSMSGVIDIKYSSRIFKKLGTTDPQEPICQSINPVRMLDRLVGTDKAVIVTCGTEDSNYYTCGLEFIARARELKVKHIAMFSPGSHSWPYWRFAVVYHIDWFNKIMKGEL